MRFLESVATIYLFVLLLTLLLLALSYGALLVARSIFPLDSRTYATVSRWIDQVPSLVGASVRAGGILFYGTIILFAALAIIYG